MDDTKKQPEEEKKEEDTVVADASDASVEPETENAEKEESPVEEKDDAPEKEEAVDEKADPSADSASSPQTSSGQENQTPDSVDTTGITGNDDKPAVKIPDNAKWYIIHTYAGHENKVARSLKQRVESMKFEDRVFDIIVPMRNTIKVTQGKKETVKEKIFPGYVLVRMVLDDESWHMVRGTQGVTSFIGAGNKPTPISEKEVEAIQKFMAIEEPLYQSAFTVGEAVKITDGPFSDFLGTIDNIDEARGKIKVLVSIFGRETPVELDFLQVKKI